jgi:hypothetical protein
MRLANNSLQNKQPDPLINYRWIEDLPSFDPLIENFIEASKNENWDFLKYLYKFLEFISVKKNIGLTLGQAEVFRFFLISFLNKQRKINKTQFLIFLCLIHFRKIRVLYKCF